MDSYGQLLRKKREEKHIDLDTAVRETSITREYIEGLESEDTSVFPGEAYLVGFLRNYAEYLGLSPENIFLLYHSKQLQEAPTPEELIARKKPSFVVPIIICGAVFFLAGVAAVIWFFLSRHPKEERGEVVVSSGYNPMSYELGEKTFVTRIYRGDQISVPASSGTVVVTVRETLSSLGIETPVGVIYTDLAEERETDIDGDTIPDIIIYVADISDTDASRGAEIRMLVKRGDGASVAYTDMDAIESVSSANQAHAPQVILEDNRAYPFTLIATFRGASVFRYRSDNSASEEYYLTNGEVVNVSSNNGIRLWMSNSNAVSFSIVADARRFDLGVGRAGQVLVEDIRWLRTTEGTYQLVVMELD